MALIACGGAKAVVAPHLAVKQAADRFADQSRMAVTLSLVAAENDAVALFNDGEELTPEDYRYLQSLLKSRLAIAFDKGADAKSSNDDSVALDVTVGDIVNAVQFRSQGNTVYARAAVDDLVSFFDGSRGDLGYFLDSATEAGFGFLTEGAKGKWLSTDVTPVQSFLDGMAEGSSNDEARDIADMVSIGPNQIKEFRDGFSAAWANDIAVERLGRDTAGDHFRLTSSPRKIYDRFLPALRKLPGVPIEDLPPSVDVPDKQLRLDMWVNNKRLTRVEFDLTQLSDSTPPPGPVTLRLDIDAVPQPIVVPKAPKDVVVNVDLVKALGQYYAHSMQQQEEEDYDWTD